MNLDSALDLYEQGFRVIPLAPKTKNRPLIPWKEFQKRMPVEEEIRQWWTRWPDANAAIVTGPEIIVIDADRPEAIEWVESTLTRTPWRVDTRPGRRHYYYATGGETPLSSATLPGGIDIRGRGGYAVAPGSTHPDGYTYRCNILPDAQATCIWDLPSLTDEDRKHLASIKRCITAISDDPHKLATPSLATPGEVIADLSQVKTPASGAPVDPGERNMTAASLAGQWLREGWSLADVKRRLAAWNQTNPDPLPADEIDTIAASVGLTAARNGQSVRLTPPPRTQAIYSLDQWDRRDLPKPECYWRGATLFAGSRVLLAGPPKKCKSMFFLGMAVAAATGGDFLGEPFSRPLKVVWAQAEIHEAWLSERIDVYRRHLTARQMGDLQENLHVTGRLRINLQARGEWERFKEEIQQIQPDIVCLDPFINFAMADEVRNDEMHRTLSIADELLDMQCVILIIHHVGKAQKSCPFEAIRGASAIRGWYDTGLVLHGDPTVLSYELRNAPAPASHGLQFNWQTGRWSTFSVEDSQDDADDEKGPQITPETVLAWIRYSDVEIAKAPQQGATLFGTSKRAIRRILRQLYTEQWICDEGGYWRINSKKHYMPDDLKKI